MLIQIEIDFIYFMKVIYGDIFHEYWPSKHIYNIFNIVIKYSIFKILDNF